MESRITSNGKKTMVTQTHRLLLIRVISAYRIISYDVVCVIVGMMPICITLEEDRLCYESTVNQENFLNAEGC